MSIAVFFPLAAPHCILELQWAYDPRNQTVRCNPFYCPRSALFQGLEFFSVVFLKSLAICRGDIRADWRPGDSTERAKLVWPRDLCHCYCLVTFVVLYPLQYPVWFFFSFWPFWCWRMVFGRPHGVVSWRRIPTCSCIPRELASPWRRNPKASTIYFSMRSSFLVWISSSSRLVPDETKLFVFCVTIIILLGTSDASLFWSDPWRLGERSVSAKL